MNGPPNTGTHWRDQPPSPNHPPGTPAIYHTAFDDLHTLAISLTRRLVSATLFQAMTRLRANDTARANQRPVPVVSAVDVRSAVDIVGLKTEVRGYWAKLPRRYQLDVYSEVAKYKDGRKGTRQGVKLTYDEVEAALGLHAAATETGRDGVGDSDFDVSDPDSDMFTEESTEDDRSVSEPANGDSATASSSADESAAINHPSPTPVPSPRKRPLSPTSFARAEDKYLETLDALASTAEERRLWEALHLEPPEPAPGNDTEVLPNPPVKKFKSDDPVGLWRDRVRYVPAWEGAEGVVEGWKYGAVGRKGRERRARREMERVKGDEGGGDDAVSGRADGNSTESEGMDETDTDDDSVESDDA